MHATSPHTPHPHHHTQVGQYANFTWQFLGLGNTSCTLDGRALSNDPLTGQCYSPLSVNVTDSSRHTLVVTLRDVCGATMRESMNYSVAEGWTAAGAEDALPPLQPLTLAKRTGDGGRTSAAAGRSLWWGRGGGGGWLAAAVLLGALLLLQ